MPDLREQLNQNRGLEAYQPDLRDRLNNLRDQGRPLGYPPIMPIVPVVDPMMEKFNELAAELQVLRANKERAQTGQAQAEDSEEELECNTFCNTPNFWFIFGFVPHA